MNTSELRELYQQFFEQRGHSRIPSAPLVPENDPTALFTSAGMHPLVPFLLGQPHPQGRRLTNVQKCIRTGDIDATGDPSHLTFFEMLGNWSLGDYFKQESLAWSYEFLTRVLGLDRARLAVTVFAGDEHAPQDRESADAWRSLGLPAERIFFLPREDNWWGPVGSSGPCGPDSEMFYDTGRPDHPGCQPGCPCGKWFEIWNNVFMEYNRRPDGHFEALPQRSVDTGMGLERTLCAINGFDDIFRVDSLAPLVGMLEELSGRAYESDPASFRIVVDHLRAATFAIADGALPSNVEAGYVVRRLIRRALRHGRRLGIQDDFCARSASEVVDLMGAAYPELERARQGLLQAMEAEETKFKATLGRAERQFERLVEELRYQGMQVMPGERAFDLFETHGLPLDLILELAGEAGLQVDQAGFEACYAQHRQQSQQRSGDHFKGGLAERTPETTRLHTATHLLHQALRQVLGTGVQQKGSNIKPERLRFDFSHPERLSAEQLKQVEDTVNRQIRRDLPVSMQTTSLQQALEGGALAFFAEKYGEQVNVYSIGDFSKEVCGGPHVGHTGELGRFRIIKEEAVGQGVRRIRAVLE
jgi:alanyl-tRNA synthetase